ncbi:MAG TPA: hypothetical protein VFB67_13005 [Candidatus Polarisedimenticolaceae bacterium]|nr:hypothetical protein [Candidatus Polarisedimenticolaceae bacterium]
MVVDLNKAVSRLSDKMGVPAGEPGAAPRWGSTSALVMHLDADGKPITHRWSPFLGVAAVYLFLCGIVGVYAFMVGGAAADDLFPAVAYVILTLPTSLLAVKWMTAGPVVMAAAPLVNVALAAVSFKTWTVRRASRALARSARM